MQESSSGSLPLSLLINEIDEVGRSLAHLTQPGSPVPREQRKEIRAVLREAVLATQADGEEGSLAQLAAVLERLRALQRTHLPAATSEAETVLAERLGRRRRFGAIDDAFLEKGRFTTAGEQHADAISTAVEARVERTLATLRHADIKDRVGTSRPIRHREELKELVTKKVK